MRLKGIGKGKRVGLPSCEGVPVEVDDHKMKVTPVNVVAFLFACSSIVFTMLRAEVE